MDEPSYEQVRCLDAGRELDALVWKHVLGGEERNGWFTPSTNIVQAMDVARHVAREKLPDTFRHDFFLTYLGDLEWDKWIADFVKDSSDDYQARASTPELAICRAALLTVLRLRKTRQVLEQLAAGAKMEKSDRFADQRTKLSQARSALMAPHPQGEEQSYAEAFRYCAEAFDGFDTEQLGEAEKSLAQTIQRLMDISGLEDNSGRGTYYERARLMSTDDRLEFSRALDDLASCL